MTWFNTNFINKLSFEVFDESIESFGSQTIAFVKYGDIYNFSENYKREKIRYNIKLSCHVIGISSTVLPSDFFLRSQWNKCCIPQIFNTLCNLLSLAYLADYAELTLENKLIFAFHGYKIIKGEWQVEQCGAFDFYKFFHFSFESDNSSDKLGVVRNIFSLHSSSDGILQPSDACYQAILSNYNIYLKKNVEQYLKLKDSISDYILQSLSKTNGLIDSYISSFRNNVITVFSFFISIVIVNGLKDHGIHNLISFDVFVVLLCLLILSVLWLRMSHSDIVSRYNYTLETLQHNLNVSYSAILCSEELASSLEPFLSQNKFFFENRIKQYTIYWTAVLVVTFSVFCIGLYYKKFDTICNWFSTFWQ